MCLILQELSLINQTFIENPVAEITREEAITVGNINMGEEEEALTLVIEIEGEAEEIVEEAAEEVILLKLLKQITFYDLFQSPPAFN